MKTINTMLDPPHVNDLASSLIPLEEFRDVATSSRDLPHTWVKLNPLQLPIPKPSTPKIVFLFKIVAQQCDEIMALPLRKRTIQ